MACAKNLTQKMKNMEQYKLDVILFSLSSANRFAAIIIRKDLVRKRTLKLYYTLLAHELLTK